MPINPYKGRCRNMAQKIDMDMGFVIKIRLVTNETPEALPVTKFVILPKALYSDKLFQPVPWAYRLSGLAG
ncbi:MAG: hypothetical protein WBQ60_08340 [Asticcacaulis sp.]